MCTNEAVGIAKGRLAYADDESSAAEDKDNGRAEGGVSWAKSCRSL